MRLRNILFIALLLFSIQLSFGSENDFKSDGQQIEFSIEDQTDIQVQELETFELNSLEFCQMESISNYYQSDDNAGLISIKGCFITEVDLKFSNSSGIILRKPTNELRLEDSFCEYFNGKVGLKIPNWRIGVHSMKLLEKKG